MTADYIPKYVQVYRMWEQGIPKHEIARRLYGIIDYKTLGIIRKLISYARKRLKREQTFSLSSNVETRHTPIRYHLYDPRTGYKIFVEGMVLEERLPETEFNEAYIPHSNPVPYSMTGLGVIFNYKSIGKIQANPPGGLGDKSTLLLNEALELMDNILGLIGVGEESIIREEAGKIIHDNKDKLEQLVDKHMLEILVVSAVLIGVLTHKPGLIGKLSRVVNELYGDVKDMITGMVYQLKIPPPVMEKAFKGLLEYIFNSK